MMSESTERKADICVYACTGHCGKNVARLICQHGDATLLLAGRNVDKVRAVYRELLTDQQGSNCQLIMHPDPVSVDNDEALEDLTKRTRLLVNCIDLQAHVRALTGVAEACVKTNTHYLDLVTTVEKMVPIFILENACSAIIVPGCGFDYAVPDVALALAEQVFRKRYSEDPESVQLTLKLRTGALGMKWPLHVVERFFKESPAPIKAPPSKAETLLPPSLETAILSYSDPLSSWTIYIYNSMITT
jgi:short subunit dehydrogenase-like uncharacterized protein